MFALLPSPVPVVDAELYSNEIGLTLRYPHPVEVAASGHSSCVLFEGGQVKCWGAGGVGQLGTGNTDNLGDGNGEMGNALSFINFGAGRTAVQISVGEKHACAVLDNGTLVCWGEGNHGRLGTGNTNDQNSPAAINLGNGVEAREVAAGKEHTCAITVDGDVKCWGRNNHGQLGIGSTVDQSSPLAVNLGNNVTASRIAVGNFHTCAITSAGLKCWGHDDQGQLGDGTKQPDQGSPIAVNLGSNKVATDIALGGWHTCAAVRDTSDDSRGLLCWGHADQGQLGDTTTTDNASPRTINVGAGVRQLSLTHKNSCAVLSDDTLKCWGLNANGQVGVGSTSNKKRPHTVNLGSSLGVQHVAVGHSHACAILSDHTVKCWGQHTSGSLGAGRGTFNWGDAAGEMGDALATVPLFGNNVSGITWGSFSGNLVVGGSSVTPGTTSSTVDGVAVDYSLLTSSNCTLDDDTTGEVSALAVDLSSTVNCRLLVTVSKSGYISQTRELSIALAAGNLGSITWGDFTATSLVVGGARARPTAPTGMLAGSTVRYTNNTTSNCELHSNTTGEISAKGVDISGGPTCDLTVTVSKTGYTSQTHDISIPLEIGSLGSITWGEFPGSTNLVVGGATVTPDTTTVADATLTYAVVSSTAANCELIDEGTGEVLAKAVDLTSTQQCTLEITLSKLGYTTQTHQISIDLAKGTQRGLAWSPGSLGALTGDGTATLDTVVGAGTIAYSVVSDGGSGCAFGTSSSSVLTYNADGTCRVQVTVTRTGYHDWTSPAYDIAIAATSLVGITWAGYPGGNVMVVGESAAPEARTFVPSGSVTEAYGASAVPSGACTVDPTNGTVSASAVGICYVTLTATESTRGAGKKVVAVRVLDQLDFTVAGEPRYPATALTLSGSLAISHTPDFDDDSIPLTWVFAAEGSRSGSSQSGVCTVDNDPTSATFGTVTAGGSAQADDICTVTITLVGDSVQGYHYHREIALPLITNAPVQVTGHANSYCALFKDNRVKCWGHNNKGQLGVGHTNNLGDGNNEMGASLPFLDFGRGRSATQVSMGYEHACAVLDNGELMCWGEGANGRLGTGNTTGQHSPALVNLGSGVSAQQVSAGEWHTCAVMVGGALKCWGRNNDGQVGDGTSTDRNNPVDVDLGDGVSASLVAAGNYHTCALTITGGLQCWGHNDQGQIGNGSKGQGDTSDNEQDPVVINLGANQVATHLSIGGWHGCVVMEDTSNSNSQSLKCWGHSDQGQVGDGGTTDRENLTAISLGNGVTVKQVSLDHKTTCVVLGDDTLKCWGYNNKGQLGAGNTTNLTSPPANAIPLGTDLTVKDVSVGKSHACAILSDDTMKCWGQHKPMERWGPVRARLYGAMAPVRWGTPCRRCRCCKTLLETSSLQERNPFV